jgi:hypothetical protein
LGLDSSDAGGEGVVQRPPEVSVDTSVIRELRFSHSVKGSKRKGKPKKMHGCRYRYLISDHPPASIAELVNAELATGRSLRLKFSEADRGKKVYFAACWVRRAATRKASTPRFSRRLSLNKENPAVPRAVHRD